jgi:hypothetical protein
MLRDVGYREAMNKPFTKEDIEVIACKILVIFLLKLKTFLI